MMEAALHQYRKPYRTIRPRSGWQALNLRDLWQARELLLTLATRDVKLRYRQTLLGVLWVVIQPVLAASIFSLVFGRIANLPSHGIPYFIFAYAGILAWNAYQTTLIRVSGCIVQNNHVIVKISFPRLVLPISTVLSVMIDFGVALLVLVVLMLVNDIRPGLGILLLPVWLFLILLFSLGVGLAAATLMVIYRDVQYVIPVLIQLWLYASPVAYAAAAVPVRLRTLYFLNPLTALLEAFRWSLLGRGEIRWQYIVYSAFASFIAFICGALIFRRLEPRFADVI
jgi:homopolymeric O-antigen transport system permease protein